MLRRPVLAGRITGASSPAFDRFSSGQPLDADAIDAELAGGFGT